MWMCILTYKLIIYDIFSFLRLWLFGRFHSIFVCERVVCDWLYGVLIMIYAEHTIQYTYTQRDTFLHIFTWMLLIYCHKTNEPEWMKSMRKKWISKVKKVEKNTYERKTILTNVWERERNKLKTFFNRRLAYICTTYSLAFFGNSLLLAHTVNTSNCCNFSGKFNRFTHTHHCFVCNIFFSFLNAFSSIFSISTFLLPFRSTAVVILYWWCCFLYLLHIIVSIFFCY